MTDINMIIDDGERDIFKAIVKQYRSVKGNVRSHPNKILKCNILQTD